MSMKKDSKLFYSVETVKEALKARGFWGPGYPDRLSKRLDNKPTPQHIRAVLENGGKEINDKFVMRLMAGLNILESELNPEGKGSVESSGGRRVQPRGIVYDDSPDDYDQNHKTAVAADQWRLIERYVALDEAGKEFIRKALDLAESLKSKGGA